VCSIKGPWSFSTVHHFLYYIGSAPKQFVPLEDNGDGVNKAAKPRQPAGHSKVQTSLQLVSVLAEGGIR
jgi:hypothetical protein